tara:strand:+ start:653 stop:817 length:165 start_codon:yes stop_codon:yes gene_type:complete
MDKLTTNETLQEFITNHLDVEDFGYLILLGDDSVSDQALSSIRGKFEAFLEGEW